MAKLRIIALVSVLVGVSLFVWKRGNDAPAPTSTKAELLTNTALTAQAITTNAVVTLSPPTHNESETMRARAVAAMLQFASAAKPFNFDPTVTVFLDRTNRLSGAIQSTTIGTPTHAVQFMPRTDGEIVQVNSSYDGSRTPRGQAQWYQCTGTWTEAEAFAETRAILQRLGETKTLAQIGNQTYEALPMKLPTPEGQTVTVTPFATVTMHDTNGKYILSAEYRLRSNGPSLVRWHYWPGMR